MKYETSDLRIASIKAVTPPMEVCEEIPISETAAQVTAETRTAIHNILQGADDRLVVVTGPCSIHDPEAAKEYAGRFFRRRIGDRLSERYQQVVGQTVQEHAKAIRHIAMVAQPIRTQLALQLLVAVFAFASLGILFVHSLRQCAAPAAVGHDGSAVGSLRVGFTLDDDPARLTPRFCLVIEAGEQSLWLCRRFVLIDRVFQEFFAVSLQRWIHADADRVVDVQPLAGFVEFRFGEAGIGS